MYIVCLIVLIPTNMAVFVNLTISLIARAAITGMPLLRPKWSKGRVLVLVLILGRSLHQADACHMASVYLGFRSIWNTHFCLRLQPHLYPSLVETSLGRDVRPNSDISQRMSSPTPPSETRNYCWIKVGDSQRWTHIENPTRLNVIDPDWV